MKILKYSETEKSKLLLRELDEANVTDAVRAIVMDVAKNGDAALFAYSKKFDRAELDALEVSEAEFDAAFASLSDELRAAMELRMAYPDEPLAELAAKADPPISKSGLNHRLRKLVSMAEALPETEDEEFEDE